MNAESPEHSVFAEVGPVLIGELRPADRFLSRVSMTTRGIADAEVEKTVHDLIRAQFAEFKARRTPPSLPSPAPARAQHMHTLFLACRICGG